MELVSTPFEHSVGSNHLDDTLRPSAQLIAAELRESVGSAEMTSTALELGMDAKASR
jgi:hypothetical protein